MKQYQELAKSLCDSHHKRCSKAINSSTATAKFATVYGTRPMKRLQL